VGAAWQRPYAPLLVGHGPPFGNQDVGVPLREFESIADHGVFKVDPIDHRRVLADQTNRPEFFRAIGSPPLGMRRTIDAGSRLSRVATGHWAAKSLKANNMPFWMERIEVVALFLTTASVRSLPISVLSTNIAMCL
jgi:hypothetical protein